jgi:hypothetical protein
MDECEKMKMLFLEHHRHLSEIKLKVQGLTQRSITIFAVATGWILLAKNPLPEKLKVVLALTILSIGISSLVALHRFNENYRKEARIISNINRYFHFFAPLKCIGNYPIYPESWKSFGTEPVFKGSWHHIITIVVMMLLSIAAIWIK